MTATSELVDTVEAALRLVDAIARHPEANTASLALQEVASRALSHIESLHQSARLHRAQQEGYTS